MASVDSGEVWVHGRAVAFVLLAGACGAASGPPGMVPNVATVTVGAAANDAVQRELAGTIACFEAGLVDEEGAPVGCELSGAAAMGNELVVFNDKPVPGPNRSSVFWIEAGIGDPVARYVPEPMFGGFRKYEDAEPWPGGGVLVTTGFDRIAEDDPKLDGFNALLLWRPDRAPRIVGASTRDGVTSSRTLRKRFAAALADERFPDGPAHFKIEGLAAMPDGRVLFGVREAGVSYEDFEYTVAILAARDLDAIEREGFADTWRFDARQDPRIEQPIGTSGLTWDEPRQRLWMTTSWEMGDGGKDVGGHLWWLAPADFDDDAPPHLVHTAAGAPWVFLHKPEAVTVLADGKLMIVHDDDRNVGDPREPGDVGRALHQSVFEVLVPRETP